MEQSTAAFSVGALTRMVTGARTDEAMRMRLLSLFLRVLCVGFFTSFVPWITLILLKAPVLAPGSTLAPLLRFRPYNPHYEVMMTVIYLVWAVMMWRASYDPASHRLFIDFTIWGNAAHGIVMLVMTPMQKGIVMTFIEGVPLLVISAVLWWLRPKPAETSVSRRATA